MSQHGSPENHFSKGWTQFYEPGPAQARGSSPVRGVRPWAERGPGSQGWDGGSRALYTPPNTAHSKACSFSFLFREGYWFATSHLPLSAI